MAARGEADAAKVGIFMEALYEAAVAHGSSKRLYSQRDLLDLDIIPQSNNTTGILIQVIQGLTNRKLFVGADRQAHGLAWRWRSREDADKYHSLPDPETALVYQIIDDAGADGVWNRTIKYRLNMHDSVIKTCIKHLESRALITSMKNVEHPNKKMYIRADLRPSDRATGGPWFTDGELDKPFIQELQNLIFEEIKNKSAYMGSLPVGGMGSIVSGGTTASGASSAAPGGPARQKKRTAVDMAASEEKPHSAGGGNSLRSFTGAPPRKKAYLPMPVRYMRFPTVHDLAQFVHSSGVTNNTTLSEADVQQLINVLVFDGLVESVKIPVSFAPNHDYDDDGPGYDDDGKPVPPPRCRTGYRVTRTHRQDTVPYAKRMLEREREGAVYAEALTVGGGGGGGGSGGKDGDKTKVPMLLTDPPLGPPPLSSALAETPCSMCPVLDLCEMGGPVNPANCEYLPPWLDMARARKIGAGKDGKAVGAQKKEVVEI